MILASAWARRVRALRSALEDEREALLDGRLDRLAAVSARIEAARASLLNARPEEGAEEALEGLRRIAHRNGRLLEAARNGIDESRRLAKNVQGEAERLGYDPNGAALKASGSRLRRA